MLPMLLSIKSVPFSDFAGARDKSIDLSLYSKRADRSVRNFRESLPVVLMLIALSIALEPNQNEMIAAKIAFVSSSHNRLIASENSVPFSSASINNVISMVANNPKNA